MEIGDNHHPKRRRGRSGAGYSATAGGLHQDVVPEQQRARDAQQQEEQPRVSRGQRGSHRRERKTTRCNKPEAQRGEVTMCNGRARGTRP
jgi:hypothetical protein